MRQHLLFLIATLCLAAPAAALTLDEAVRAALDNHQRIVQFRANSATSQAEVGSARAAFYPSIDLGYNYQRQDQDPYGFGRENSSLRLSGSLNLFNGLADHRSLMAARHRANAADFQLKGVRADILLDTRKAYIEVLRAENGIATAGEGVELLQRQQRDSSLRFEHGVIARNDLLRVEVELSSARQEMLRAQGDFRNARRALERVTGLKLARDETLQEYGDPRQLAFDLDQKMAFEQELLAKRSELNYLRELLQAAQRSLAASRSGYLPKLDLSLAHERYGDSLLPNGREQSYGHDSILLLSANWNLFNGFATQKGVAAAAAEARALKAELQDTTAALLLQLEVALNDARIAAGVLEESGVGVSQAEENYRVTENRYRQQQATTFDLLDARFLLTRARNQQVNARYDLYLATATLARIIERPLPLGGSPGQGG